MSIAYMENGLLYTHSSCGLTEVGKEITKEEYDRLSALDKNELNEIIAEETPGHIFQGYGFYGSFLIEKEGRYYVGRVQGSSCE